MRGQLQRVARYQRWFLAALLVNVVITLVALLNAFDVLTVSPTVFRILGYVRFPLCIFMSIATFLLAKQFWGVPIALAWVALTWIPFVHLAMTIVWFIILLILNQKATRLLQKWGIQAGLLGAKPSLI